MVRNMLSERGAQEKPEPLEQMVASLLQKAYRMGSEDARQEMADRAAEAISILEDIG